MSDSVKMRFEDLVISDKISKFALYIKLGCYVLFILAYKE
nr:MAG TPA: hypothetical protein [Caudoviricetes sp.]